MKIHNSCPYCKGNASKYVVSNDINQKITELEFTYYRCNICGLIFLNPIPADIQKYYGQEYPAYRVEDINKEVTDYDLGKIAIVKRYAHGKKLLEIGPGGGTFAHMAKQEGFIVDAIEMDAGCCKFLKESIKIQRVVNTTDVVGSLDKLEGEYDVIVMWHVLEHLKNSWEVMRSLARLLATGGIIILAVPNPDALQFRLFKKYWKHLDAPRHVAFVPMNLMAKEMSRHGLETVAITTNDEVSRVFNNFGWWLNSLGSFTSESSSKFLNSILKKRRIAQIIYLLAVGWLEKVDGNGNAYLAVFRRK